MAARGFGTFFHHLKWRRDDAPLAHRVHRVEEERHEDLHELLSVRLRHAGEHRIELGLDRQSLESHMMFEQQ